MRNRTLLSWHRRLSVMACVVLPVLNACVSADEKERRATAAMVERAKADAVAESVFVHDSLSLAASITVDSVERMMSEERGATDADGNAWTETIFKAVTARGAVCIVDSTKAHTLLKGDTLSCQWEKTP